MFQFLIWMEWKATKAPSQTIYRHWTQGKYLISFTPIAPTPTYHTSKHLSFQKQKKEHGKVTKIQTQKFMYVMCILIIYSVCLCDIAHLLCLWLWCSESGIRLFVRLSCWLWCSCSSCLYGWPLKWIKFCHALLRCCLPKMSSVPLISCSFTFLQSCP